MSFFTKIHEAMIGLRAGRVTLPYPATPAPAPTGFRGRPMFDAARCIGCAGCANNCPARAILVSDPCQEIRVLLYLGRRCAYCGRCAEVCPEHAIKLGPDYEMATNQANDLDQRLELFMSTCQRCGRCFKDSNPLDALQFAGYREDDLDRMRWIPRSRSTLQGSTDSNDIGIELD